jgi:hypothetical protein
VGEWEPDLSTETPTREGEALAPILYAFDPHPGIPQTQRGKGDLAMASYMPNDSERNRVIDAIRAFLDGPNGGSVIAAIRIADLYLGADFDVRRARKMVGAIPGVRRDYSNTRPVPYHLIDQPPMEGERRTLDLGYDDGAGDYPADLHGYFGKAI